MTAGYRIGQRHRWRAIQEIGTAEETFAAQGSYSVVAAGCSVAGIRRRFGTVDYRMQLEWPVGKDCRAAVAKEARE